MQRELRVGVVDSGVPARWTHRIAAATRFVIDGGNARESDPLQDQIGHGGAVLDLLIPHLATFPIWSAQVFDNRPTTTSLQVAAAIRWLVHADVDLINLSLGLRTDRPVLRAACDEASAAGIVLVASSPARGAPVYPAGYPGVIRVTGDARCEPGQWSWLNSSQADFGAHVDPTTSFAGASMACALMSGRIGAHLAHCDERTAEAAMQFLREGAVFRGPQRPPIPRG